MDNFAKKLIQFYQIFYPEEYPPEKKPFVAKDIIRITENNLGFWEHRAAIRYFTDKYCKAFPDVEIPLIPVPTPRLPSIPPVEILPKPIIFLPAPVVVPSLPLICPPQQLLPPVIKLVPTFIIPKLIPLFIKKLIDAREVQAAEIEELEFEVENYKFLYEQKITGHETLMSQLETKVSQIEALLIDVLNFYAKEKEYKEYIDKLEELWPSDIKYTPEWVREYETEQYEEEIPPDIEFPEYKDVVIDDYEMKEWFTEDGWVITITDVKWQGTWYDLWDPWEYDWLPTIVREYVVVLRYYLEELYYGEGN